MRRRARPDLPEETTASVLPAWSITDARG